MFTDLVEMIQVYRQEAAPGLDRLHCTPCVLSVLCSSGHISKSKKKKKWGITFTVKKRRVAGHMLAVSTFYSTEIVICLFEKFHSTACLCYSL